MTDYICILDFEATCWEENRNHEIIEFPSVLLAWTQDHNDMSKSKKRTYKIHEISRIQLFVKPMINPTVSKFCHKLTGITQKQVDKGIPLQTALTKHLKWLHGSLPGGTIEGDRVTIVTHGDWDLDIMLPMDLKNIKIAPCEIYQRYVNIKDLFHKITGEKGMGMAKMLKFLKLKLEGRHHSGIDDCHNIARMFVKLVEMGIDKNMFMDKMKHVNMIKYVDKSFDKPSDKSSDKMNENFNQIFEFDENSKLIYT